jgi:hypothetical protein
MSDDRRGKRESIGGTAGACPTLGALEAGMHLGSCGITASGGFDCRRLWRQLQRRFDFDLLTFYFNAGLRKRAFHKPRALDL